MSELKTSREGLQDILETDKVRRYGCGSYLYQYHLRTIEDNKATKPIDIRRALREAAHMIMRFKDRCSGMMELWMLDMKPHIKARSSDENGNPVRDWPLLVELVKHTCSVMDADGNDSWDSSILPQRVEKRLREGIPLSGTLERSGIWELNQNLEKELKNKKNIGEVMPFEKLKSAASHFATEEQREE